MRPVNRVLAGRGSLGGFPFPMPAGEAKEIEMTAADLQLVLQGIDPQKVKRTKRYQRPAAE